MIDHARVVALAFTLIGCGSDSARRAPASPPEPAVTEAIPADLLATLRARAAAEHSSALVIRRSGEVVLEDYFGQEPEPLVAMSATKSVAAIAVAHVIESGKLSLDTPLSEVISDWDDGDHPPITVRHLLDHTSGLATERADFATGDIVEHARRSKRLAPPGQEFRYNNNAVDLLGAVVRPRTGMFIDDYLDAHIFGPMDIAGAYWLKDTAGNPRTAGELVIEPADLAKLGQLMLDEGRWGERQLLAPATVRMLIERSQTFAPVGLLWWLEQAQSFALTQEILDAWKRDGLPEPAAARAQALVGKTFATAEAYKQAVREALPTEVLEPLNQKLVAGTLPWVDQKPRGPLLGYSARGWLGQYLVVVPACELVAVRMRAPRPEDYEDQTGKGKDTYDHFIEDVLALGRDLECLEPAPG